MNLIRPSIKYKGKTIPVQS